MAKFHFRNFVEQSDVDQAIKLIDYSFRTLEEIKGEQPENRIFSKYFITFFLNIEFFEYRKR